MIIVLTPLQKVYNAHVLNKHLTFTNEYCYKSKLVINMASLR